MVLLTSEAQIRDDRALPERAGGLLITHIRVAPTAPHTDPVQAALRTYAAVAAQTLLDVERDSDSDRREAREGAHCTIYTTPTFLFLRANTCSCTGHLETHMHTMPQVL